MLLALVPIVGRRQVRVDPLVVMRRLFLSFCGAFALIFVVLVFLFDSRGHQEPNLGVGAAVAITAAAGIVGLVARRVFADQPLDCTDARSLASSYRSRFFVRMAIAETTALLGFVLCFVAQSLWPYVAALPFTAVGFWLAAPTRRHLAHDQARLSASGCEVNLLAALRAVRE